MDEHEKRRLADNEDAYRKVNEALRASKGLADASRTFPFACECAVLGCNKLIELTLPEYEAVRASPVRFAIVDGHEITATERVVERNERFTTIEKFGEGAAQATRTDPR